MKNLALQGGVAHKTNNKSYLGRVRECSVLTSAKCDRENFLNHTT